MSFLSQLMLLFVHCFSLSTHSHPTPPLVLLCGKEGGRKEIGKARSRINGIKLCKAIVEMILGESSLLTSKL